MALFLSFILVASFCLLSFILLIPVGRHKTLTAESLMFITNNECIALCRLPRIADRIALIFGVWTAINPESAADAVWSEGQAHCTARAT